MRALALLALAPLLLGCAGQLAPVIGEPAHLEFNTAYCDVLVTRLPDGQRVRLLDGPDCPTDASGQDVPLSIRQHGREVYRVGMTVDGLSEINVPADVQVVRLDEGVLTWGFLIF